MVDFDSCKMRDQHAVDGGDISGAFVRSFKPLSPLAIKRAHDKKRQNITAVVEEMQAEHYFGRDAIYFAAER